MTHGLDTACEKAEYFLEVARQCPPKLKLLQSSTSKWKSIPQKLTELYMEECGKKPKLKHLRSTSHLLEKLVSREKLNCLVLNLYPGNEGYSLMLKGRTGVDTETMRLPYEETELLECINNEELPPILVDLLDRSQVHIFYHGCVIVEVRDYRRSAIPTIYDSRHVLLKPTLQTLLCDVNMIANDSSKWSVEDKQFLESQLLLATQEPLCLNPSYTVALLANRLQYKKNKFNTVLINKSVKKYSQAAINRKRKFESYPAPPELQLHDFVQQKQNKEKYLPRISRPNKILPPCELWRDGFSDFLSPELVEVAKLIKMDEKPETPDSNAPILIEEYTFESEPNHGKVSHMHLTIRRLPVEEMYQGELYIDKDYVEGQEKGTTCTFSFGSRALVDRYIKQFKDIVTEEGRKSMKIMMMAPGQPPKPISSQVEIEYLPAISPMALMLSPGPQMKQIVNRVPGSSNSPNIISPLPTSSPSGSSMATQVPTTVNRSMPHPITLPAQTPPQPTTPSPGPPNVTSPPPSLPTYTQAVSQASSTAKSAPTPPPPRNRTPTPRSTPTPPIPTRVTTPGLPRRPPSTDNFTTTLPQLPVTSPTVSTSVGPLGLIGGVPLSLAGILTTGNGDPTAMSLGMPMPSGIAVPISLAMMHATQSTMMTTPIVGSMPGLMGSGTSHGCPVAITTSGTSVSGPAVIVTSGMLTSSSPVLANHSNMLPIGMGMPTGTLNQLMASGLKGTPQGLRAAAPPLSLLQVSNAGGQPTLSLFSPLHRPMTTAQGKPIAGAPLAANLARSVTPSPPARSGPTPPPSMSVTPPIMTTLLPQPQAILSYSKQTAAPASQAWPQQPQQPATLKSKSRKRSTPASAARDAQGRNRDGGSKNK